MDFYDGLHSMPRLLGKTVKNLDNEKAFKNPWSSHVPTLVEKSKIIMRITTFEGSSPNMVVRCLEGYECLQIAGFDLQCNKTDPVSFPFDTAALTSLAGNAFSGFAVAAVALTSMAAWGLTAPPIPPEKSDDEHQQSEETSGGPSAKSRKS